MYPQHADHCQADDLPQKEAVGTRINKTAGEPGLKGDWRAERWPWFSTLNTYQRLTVAGVRA